MNDDFEQQLQRQSPRQPPREWRGEILDTARAASSQPHPPPFVLQVLASLLWPHPRAWAGLAAVWLVILVLNLSAHDGSPRTAQKSAPPAPETIVALRQQQRLLAELIGSPETARAEEPPRPGRAPRSERRDGIQNA